MKAIKLAFTIADASDMVHAGGEVSRKTYVVEVTVPDAVAKHIADKAVSEYPKYCYESMSISVVEESATEGV